MAMQGLTRKRRWIWLNLSCSFWYCCLHCLHCCLCWTNQGGQGGQGGQGDRVDWKGRGRLPSWLGDLQHFASCLGPLYCTSTRISDFRKIAGHLHAEASLGQHRDHYIQEYPAVVFLETAWIAGNWPSLVKITFKYGKGPPVLLDLSSWRGIATVSQIQCRICWIPASLGREILP